VAEERHSCFLYENSKTKELIMLKIISLSSIVAISFLFSTTALCKDSLHKAAYRGDRESVNKILKGKVNPDERDSFGGTALHAAMFQKNTEIITVLINYGFDVNAQGLSNGYTPLHDAVWANNLATIKILLKRGARTDIRGKDGLTPYEKTLKEDKKEIAEYLQSKHSDLKDYDREAKASYSENDVKAFVYTWFAGFDHQADIGVFKKHLNPEKIDMYFPDFPIRNIRDFERWYKNVIDTIQWNAHKISDLKVSGDERSGYFISLDMNWKAKTYKGEMYDLNIHQDWIVKVDQSRNFVIEKHKARVIEKK
jgi:hypothetical protein